MLILINIRALDNELLQAKHRLLQVIFLFYFKLSFLDRCRKAVENAIYAHFIFIRGAVSNFCPFAFKVRSTTLIFVECITFHQTSLLDDVHKVLAVFIGHQLCFWYVFEYTPHILKYSKSGLTLTLKLPA